MQLCRPTGFFPAPAIAEPSGITTGPDGNLWFTGAPNVIGRLTPTGVVDTFTASGLLHAGLITASQDGNLWFTSTGSIGRITPAGVITLFTDPSLGEPF